MNAFTRIAAAIVYVLGCFVAAIYVTLPLALAAVVLGGALGVITAILPNFS